MSNADDCVIGCVLFCFGFFMFLEVGWKIPMIICAIGAICCWGRIMWRWNNE